MAFKINSGSILEIVFLRILFSTSIISFILFKNHLSILVISKISSIDNVDILKSYTNLKLFINKSELPSLEKDEFYWHDLIGMHVLDCNNNDELGDVIEISNYGSNDLLEISPSDSSVDSKKRQIPFVKKIFIIEIDLKNRKILVDWPKDF